MQDNLKNVVERLATIAIQAADPYRCVQKALRDAPLLPLKGGRYKVIAIGKAATMMMKAVLDHLPSSQKYDAIIVTNYENATSSSAIGMDDVELIAAGHPVPDENGLKAGKRVETLLYGATEHDHVICLISGGGSALLPTPAGQVSLAEKADISQMMLSAGLNIMEMNSVRQHLSRLKGGGMAHIAAPALLTSFILSDVIGDDLRVIASGPTVAPIATCRDVMHMLNEKGLFEKLPDSAKDIFEQHQLDKSISNRQNHLVGSNSHLVGSNRLSLDAMLAAMPDEDITLISDRLVGDVNSACQTIISAVEPDKIHQRKIFIWGGETTVHVTGGGLGGRNQELALRVALAAERWSCDFAFGSIGTDGRDGPTDAAGGIVDNQTVSKMRNAGLDPETILAQNDSYNGLKSADDLLITGATGTNVADIQILVCQPRQNLSH